LLWTKFDRILATLQESKILFLNCHLVSNFVTVAPANTHKSSAIDESEKLYWSSAGGLCGVVAEAALNNFYTLWRCSKKI
jgi:hypothetical protein